MGVKSLQRTRGNLVQRIVPYLGNDLLVDALLVGLLGMFLQRVLTVGLIPEVHPLTESHIGRAFLSHRTKLSFELFELFKAFGFGYGCHVLGLWSAFFIITDNDASFPAPILTLG